MKNNNENATRFMQIYDTLTPENRARLAALLAEVQRSQEAASDSLLSEKEKE